MIFNSGYQKSEIKVYANRNRKGGGHHGKCSVSVKNSKKRASDKA